jgi:hypothetical protein
MKKSEIEFHSDNNWRSKNPAINVKVYKFLSAEKVIEKFKCTREDAERALGFAFESAQERFWDDIEGTAKEIFGKEIQVFSEGRSGGWLTVHHLPQVEDWDAILVNKWSRFAKAVEEEIAHLTSEENVMDDIESNRWTEPMSERYNFCTTATDEIVCIAELNQKVAKYREELLK